MKLKEFAVGIENSGEMWLCICYAIVNKSLTDEVILSRSSDTDWLCVLSECG